MRIAILAAIVSAAVVAGLAGNPGRPVLRYGRGGRWLTPDGAIFDYLMRTP